ncbi:MAG: PIN domain-containing protein [Coriobacteriia bacterium]|nr:PIN domain-containing protein [Coriobacteriia bacterium]
MAAYLVDYESAYECGLEGIEQLTCRDHVAIFYDEHSRPKPCDAEKYFSYLRTEAHTVWLTVEQSDEAGSDWLGLQLAAYLGALLGSDASSETEFVIVSRRHEHSAVAAFWKRHRPGTDITVQETIAGCKPTPAPSPLGAEMAPALIAGASSAANGPDPLQHRRVSLAEERLLRSRLLDGRRLSVRRGAAFAII